jgi:hypothetical protein
MSALLLAFPCIADGDEGDGRGHGKKCSPAGTWFGGNAEDEEFVLTITRVGGGRYMAVAEGVNASLFCLSNTAFRGELVRTGRNTYELRQILFCEPDPLFYDPTFFPPDLPVIWAVRAGLELTSCDSIDGVIDDLFVYSWLSGKTPFIDPTDVPVGDISIEFSYSRMPMP